MSTKTKEIPIPLTGNPEEWGKLTPLLSVILEEFCKTGFTMQNAMSLLDSVIFFISQRAETTPKEVAAELLKRATDLQEAYEKGYLTSKEPVATVDLRGGGGDPNPHLH